MTGIADVTIFVFIFLCGMACGAGLTWWAYRPMIKGHDKLASSLPPVTEYKGVIATTGENGRFPEEFTDLFETRKKQ